VLFNWTRFGVLARATIQVPHMAAALGVDTRLIYSLTFACGAGLAGLAGGLYAPTMTLGAGPWAPPSSWKPSSRW